MPFKQKSRRRGRWNTVLTQTSVKCWACHKQANMLWLTWTNSTSDCCSLMGAWPLVTALGTHPCLYRASCLLGWGSPTKGKGEVALCPEGIFRTSSPEEAFERKDCTWQHPDNKSTTAATNCWALSRVELCGKRLLILSTQNSPLWELLSHSPSLKPRGSWHAPSTSHRLPASTPTHPGALRTTDGLRGKPKQRYVNYVI